jgi:hypothetical protein
MLIDTKCNKPGEPHQWNTPSNNAPVKRLHPFGVLQAMFIYDDMQVSQSVMCKYLTKRGAFT